MGVKLSRRAAKWLINNPGIIDRLIELAADTDSFVSVRIAKALRIPHPKLTKKTLGAPVTVDDDRLIELRSQGLTYKAIEELVGLSAAQIGNRLRKLRIKNNLKEIK